MPTVESLFREKKKMMRHSSNPQRSKDEDMNKFKYCPYDGYRYSSQDTFCFICKQPRNFFNAESEE